MSIASEITRIKNNIAGAYVEAETKGATMPATENSENLASTIATIPSGGETPSTGSQGIFTGATIPLTYKDNTHANENTYEYKSAFNITIAGLDGRATITGNGTKMVSVAFDVTSATSSLAEFTITVNGVSYKGLHAHYGTTVTGILTLAYTNVPRSGTGTVGVEYIFIESADSDLPLFSTNTTLWNGIYSYQLLNVLIGNYSLTSIGAYFLYSCYSFNQPLDISGVASIPNDFMESCFSFNQLIIILSTVTSIGTDFMLNCYALSTITWNSSTFPTDNDALAQNQDSKPSANGSGIIVYGTQRAGLLTALPNQTTSPYRKLINGGAD